MTDPAAKRQFALQTVEQLRARGYQAVWAGGCVRDQLLGLVPKDYDVATNAKPDEVREVFGRRRTIAIGASFGVIALLGPKEAGQIDVATFRRDVSYSDGRRPDAIAFTDAEEDARRRDFTINGLFFDPIDNQVIDYVEGQRDLECQVVRAIGDARERFTEDKLRMLRAVRFASTLAGFSLDDATREAVVEMAEEIQVVSAERIAAELRRMLTGGRSGQALRMLADCRLLAILLPEWTAANSIDRAAYLLDALQPPTLGLALAAIFHVAGLSSSAEEIGRRWRLSNDEIDRSKWISKNATALDDAPTTPWSRVQPLLIHPFAADLVELHAARDAIAEGGLGTMFARERLTWTTERLNPPPLVSGDDLKRHDIPSGKHYKRLLEDLRDAQLDGTIATPAEALALAERIYKT